MGKGGGSQKLQVTEYRMSVHVGVALAGVDAIRRIFVDEKVAWEGNVSTSGPITINKPGLFGGEKKEGGVGGTAYFLKGGATQTMPDGLASRMGLLSATCPAYRHLTSVFFVGDVGSSSTGTDWSSDAGDYEEFDGDGLYELRRAGSRYKGFYWGHNTPFIRPFWIEVEDFPRALDQVLETDLAQIGNDANPAHIIYECLTDTEFGMGAPAASVNAAGSFAAAAQTLYNEAFGLSFEWVRQSEIEEFVQEVLDHIQAVCYPDPSTGKWELKLLRADYDVEALETFDMSNASVQSFQRKAWGTLADEMTVAWTNPDNEKKETLTLHNLASVESRGSGTNSTTRQFPGIRNAELATTVCARELRQASAPLAAVELEVENTGSAPIPGSVHRFDWPEYEEVGLVMRVMNVEEGRGSAKVRVSLLEDIFSLTKPTLPAQPGTGWESTSSDPEAVTTYNIFTLPYALTVPALPAAGDDALEYPEALAGLLAYQEDSDVYQVDVLTEVVLPNSAAVYQDTGARDVGTLGALTESLSAEVESSIATPPGAEVGRSPVEGGYALIVGADEAASEMCLVKADPSGGWMLQRGILDTTPKNWSAGTLVWYFDNADAVADVSRVRAGGEVARYKLLARTSLGTLDASGVSSVSATLTDRPHRPSRPANVKVDGVAFGAVSLAGKTEVVVTWARRNRLTEDSVPLAWNDGDVVPEAGQTTVIRALDTSGDLIKAWVDVPGTSVTIPVSDFAGETAVLLQVFSSRDDLASLQSANVWLLGSGVSEPSLPDGYDDLDDVLPGTSSIVEGGDTSNWNLCPDPHFQDPVLWGFGAGPWASVSRNGSSYPAQLGAPKCALLASDFYNGSESQTLETPLLGGLFGDGEELRFSAKALNSGAGDATLTVEVTFHRSQDGAQVGDAQQLVWGNGESGYQELNIVPPAGADARKFRVFNEDSATWSADAAVADIQLVRRYSPDTRAVGGVASDRVAQAVDDADVMAEVIIREALDRRDRIRAEIDGVWDTFGTANAFLLEVQDWTDQAEQFSIVASSSATTAGNSATAAAGYRDQALTYADNAGNSASAASTSATAAAASETAAGNSATAASGFSGTAQTAATAAGDSASAAAVSATAASDSATAAGNSATAAGGFASDAETQATAAGDSASSASTSATAAASSATAAGNSATAASGSASTASTAATAAGDSASAASTSATAAASSATAAGNSATAASGFSSTAETAATAAGDSASAASTSATAAASASDAAGDSATAASGFASDASASATEAGEEAAATLTLRTEAQTAASNAATSATQAATASTNAASSATAASNSATAAGNSATASSSSAATADTHRAAAEANAVLAAQYGASSKTDVIDAEDFFTSDLAGLDYSAAAFTGWTEDSISSVGPVVYSTTSTISFGSRARFNPKPGRRYRVTAIWRWTTGTVGTVSVGFRADPLVTGSATNRWSAVTAGSVNEWREASYEITATEGMAEESWRPVIYRTGNTGRIEVRALVWEDLSAFRAAGEDATTVYSTAEEAYAARLIQTSAGAASATISMVARQSDGSAASRIIIAANTIAFGDDELVEITDAGEIIGWDATRAVKMLHWDPENETLQIRKSDGTLQWDSDLGGVTIDGVPGESRTQIGSLGIGTNVTLSGTTLVCDSDITGMYASGAITCSGYLFISTGDDATGSSQTGSWDLTLTKTGETPVVLVSGTYTTSQATPTEDFEAVIPLAFVEPIPFGGDVTLQLNAGSTGTASGRIRLTRSL